MKLRVLLVDDEAPARRRLRSLLAAEPRAEVVGEAASGPEAADLIRSLSPDVVFLDIRMPGMSGLDLAQEVGPEAMPAVVFVTAYDEFAVEAFDLEAADYVLKPFGPERLARAFERAAARAGSREGTAVLARVLERLRPAAGPLRRIVVRETDRLFFVPVAEVVRLSAEGNYVMVRTKDARHLVRETLASLEAKLDPQRFARVHRSEIVAVDWIREVRPTPHGDATVVMRNGDEVRLSRRYLDRLLPGEAKP